VLSLRQDKVIFQLRKGTFLLLSLIILELASIDRVTLHAPILYYGKEREKKKCIKVKRRHVLYAWDTWLLSMAKSWRWRKISIKAG